MSESYPHNASQDLKEVQADIDQRYIAAWQAGKLIVKYTNKKYAETARDYYSITDQAWASTLAANYDVADDANTNI